MSFLVFKVSKKENTSYSKDQKNCKSFFFGNLEIHNFSKKQTDLFKFSQTLTKKIQQPKGPKKGIKKYKTIFKKF